MIDPNELLSGQEAAEYLGISRARIYALARQGRLGREIGGYWMFTRGELDAYKAEPKSKGGRPKDEMMTPTPVVIR